MRIAAAVVALSLVACRPGQGPRPVTAIVDELITANTTATFEATLRAFTDEGFPLRISDAARHTVETDYFDITGHRMEAAQYPRQERFVRFRGIASVDSAGRGTHLVIQVLYAPFARELDMMRRNERSVPRDHPGALVAISVAEKIKDAVR